MVFKDKLSRRDFGKILLKGVGTIAAASAAGRFAFESEQSGYDPISIFIDLGLKIETPDEVAARFVRADSAFLMASYAVFFPEMIRRQGFGAVSALKVAADNQKSTYSKDHHRLEALPAVAAAHLLPCANSEPTRRVLSGTILDALKSPKRETQEIVLQNLVTSVAPNFDSVRFFSAENSIVARVKGIIRDAVNNEKQTMAAVICVEFLLNAKALLISRNAPKKEIAVYDEAIKFALGIRARHLQFLPELIRLHTSIFTASPRDIASLPPQSSEALMGWRRSPRSREYLSALAFSRARITYAAYRTASGELSPDSSMSMEEAKRALPKLVGFLSAFEIEQLLEKSPIVERMSLAEPLFAKFLKSELPEILKSPAQFGMPMEEVRLPPEVVELRDCVPFVKFEDRGLLIKAIQDKDARYAKGLVQGGTAVGAVVALAASIEGLVRWFGGRSSSVKVSDEMIKEAVVEIEKREAAVDAGLYRGLDEQQEELGDIDTRELS